MPARGRTAPCQRTHARTRSSRTHKQPRAHARARTVAVALAVRQVMPQVRSGQRDRLAVRQAAHVVPDDLLIAERGPAVGARLRLKGREAAPARRHEEWQAAHAVVVRRLAGAVNLLCAWRKGGAHASAEGRCGYARARNVRRGGRAGGARLQEVGAGPVAGVLRRGSEGAGASEQRRGDASERLRAPLVAPRVHALACTNAPRRRRAPRAHLRVVAVEAARGDARHETAQRSASAHAANTHAHRNSADASVHARCEHARVHLHATPPAAPRRGRTSRCGPPASRRTPSAGCSAPAWQRCRALWAT
jgi:hypothetical protein